VSLHAARLSRRGLRILIDGKPLPLDELKREVLQCLGIEVEMRLSMR